MPSSSLGIVARRLDRARQGLRRLAPLEVRDDLAADPDRVALVAREVVGHAGDPRVHLGAAELLVVGVLAGRHLHQRRPGEVDLRLVLDHDHVVAHPRDVRAARGRAAEHQADRRDPGLRAPGQVAEPAPAGHEDLRLHRQVGARRLDHRDRRQPVVLGDVGQPPRLPRRHLADRAALDRGLARGDQALDPGHPADPADQPGARRVARHVLAGERAQLEEVRVAIEHQLDPLARQQLAGRPVPAGVLLAAAQRRLVQRGASAGRPRPGWPRRWRETRRTARSTRVAITGYGWTSEACDTRARYPNAGARTTSAGSQCRL